MLKVNSLVNWRTTMKFICFFFSWTAANTFYKHVLLHRYKFLLHHDVHIKHLNYKLLLTNTVHPLYCISHNNLFQIFCHYQVSATSTSGPPAPTSPRRAASSGCPPAAPSPSPIGMRASPTTSSTRTANRRTAWNCGTGTARD